MQTTGVPPTLACLIRACLEIGLPKIRTVSKLPFSWCTVSCFCVWRMESLTIFRRFWSVAIIQTHWSHEMNLSNSHAGSLQWGCKVPFGPWLARTIKHPLSTNLRPQALYRRQMIAMNAMAAMGWQLALKYLKSTQWTYWSHGFVWKYDTPKCDGSPFVPNLFPTFQWL